MANLLHFPTTATTKDRDEPPPDWHERDRALDTRVSWIVEAPAGSGKTGLLIQRYLKLLAGEDIDEPEQVLAITFTLKATAEMRDRVLAQLEAAASNAPLKSEFDRHTRALARAVLDRDRRMAWSLLENPRRVNIRTIDSVCAEIARSLPVLSGSGRQTPATDAGPMYREAARRTLMQLGGDDAPLHDALRTILLHRDGNLADCESLIAGMLATRDQWGTLVPLGEELKDDAYLDRIVLPRLERALELTICQALTQLTNAIPAGVLRELTEAAREFAYFDGYNGRVSPIALCANRSDPPEERSEHLEHWRALIHLLVTPSSGTWRKSLAVNHIFFAMEKPHKARLKALIESLQHDDDLLQAICRISKLPPAQYPAEQWIVAKALFRILNRALVELQLVFAASGSCDFAEVGLTARAALAQDSGVSDLAAALGMKTRHLLVDEMQDTSTSQYELIARLTHGWDGVSQTVFLVGDPKQSIYRFRQARVERFIRAMHEESLNGLPLGCLRLTANFRSQQRLVDQYNEDFSQLFPRAVNLAHPEEVPYVRASAVRPGEGPGVTWHPHVIDAHGDREAAASLTGRQAKQDARAIRAIASEWMHRPLPANQTAPWRIAVLVRSRQHLAAIVAELKKDRGQGAIPFRAVEIEQLAERQEILDLTGLTRALLHPADRVAWLAVLHAPWCGLGLADLHMLTGADDRTLKERCVADLVYERGHLLSEEGEQRLAQAWTVLDAAISQRGRVPLSQWVERTWRSLGGDVYLDAGERANVMRFFRLLDEMEAAGDAVDLALLEQRMKKLYAEPAVHPGAVDLMTIHGAKGLEWDVVMVPALEKRARPERPALLNWMEIDAAEDEAAHLVLAPIEGRGKEAAELTTWIRSVNATREAAERKRLLYVAFTRAREALHLFAAPERSTAGAISPQPSSLLRTAWPFAEAIFTTHASSASEATADPFILDLAAAGTDQEDDLAEVRDRPPILKRLPLHYDPGIRFADARRLPSGLAEPPLPNTPFERPEGSFAARSFGNAVHAFLELVPKQIAAGIPLKTLRADVAGWLPRAAAVLRSDGLPPALVAREAQRVIEALVSTLDDPQGLWIMHPHPEAVSEYALSYAQADEAGTRRNVRLDRIFRAGATPEEAGIEYLWIVDFKTAAHSASGLEEFLERERAKYQPQLETYARTVAMQRGSYRGMRLALYYPLLAKLVWWPAPDDAAAI